MDLPSEIGNTPVQNVFLGFDLTAAAVNDTFTKDSTLH